MSPYRDQKALLELSDAEITRDDPFFSERFVSQNNLKGSQTHSVAASAQEGQNLRLGWATAWAM
jgi:hypothetical protein